MSLPVVLKYSVYCLFWLSAYAIWKLRGWPLELWQAGLLGAGGIVAGQVAYVAARRAAHDNS